MSRMTHAAYVEFTLPTHSTATSAEFSSERDARAWVRKTEIDLTSVGATITAARVEPMPDPATVREVEQDGRYFFTADDGDCGRVLYVVGTDVVRDDYDTAGAQRARAMFLAEFPNAVFGGAL